MGQLSNILEKVNLAKKELIKLDTNTKNEMITSISKALVDNIDSIIEENKKDIDAAIQKGMTKAMINRLELDEEKIKSIASDMLKIVSFQFDQKF